MKINKSDWELNRSSLYEFFVKSDKNLNRIRCIFIKKLYNKKNKKKDEFYRNNNLFSLLNSVVQYRD